MNNPNDRMTKLQANVIKRRKDEWGESVILKHFTKRNLMIQQLLIYKS